MNIASVNFDRYATFYKNANDRAANGAPVDRWVEAGTGWVSKQDVGGRTAFIAAREAAQIETQFITRWRDDVVPMMRIQIEGRTWDITRVDEIGRKEGLLIFGKVRAE